MERKIIVVVGLPGSGKSEVSKEIKKRKIPTFISGEVIWQEVSKRGLDLTIETEEYVARELRKQYGPDAPIKLIEHKIKQSGSELICVDGPRSIPEVESLQGLGEVYLVVVDCPTRLRYNRLRKRAGPRDPDEWKQFLWRNKKELDRGMKSLIKTQKFKKYIIVNKGSIPQLRARISKILKEIRSK